MPFAFFTLVDRPTLQDKARDDGSDYFIFAAQGFARQGLQPRPTICTKSKNSTLNLHKHFSGITNPASIKAPPSSNKH